MISLNTAYHSLRSSALDLNTQARAQTRAVTQLSSGLAAPEASGSAAAVVYKMRTEANRQDTTVLGMANALSFLDAQGAALQHVYAAVSRMSEIATQMQDPTKGGGDPENGSFPDLEAYMAEFNQLSADIWNTRRSTFNGTNLMYVSGARTTMSVSLSGNGRQRMNITASDFSTEPTWRFLLGYSSNPNASAPDPSTMYLTSPTDVLDPEVMGPAGFDTLLNDVSQKIALNGAQRSQLETHLGHLRGSSEAKARALDTIEGVDVANAVSHLARSAVLANSAVAMRTQANVLSDAALWVLRG